MPSGRTHDSITLWSLPLIAGLSLVCTQDGSLALVTSGGFLFSGLMFGPDLDIHSKQYRRWGWLRWIWLPYRRSLRHRSFWSHGFLVGTIVRLLYLFSWFLLLIAGVIVLGAFIAYGQGQSAQWYTLVQQQLSLTGQRIRQVWTTYPIHATALVVGLELGAMSHSMSDWLGSTYKRLRNADRKKYRPSSSHDSRDS